MSSKIQILKFGGTSVADAIAMNNVYKIIKTTITNSIDTNLIIFLSATAKTTDQLLETINFALKNDLNKALETKNKIYERHFKIIKDLDLTKDNKLVDSINDLFKKLEILIKGVYYLGEITPKAKDSILATGELCSTLIFSSFLKIKLNNISSSWFDIREVMITDSNFSQATPDFNEIKNQSEKVLIPFIKNYTIIITQGFIGSTKSGETTTLGRGGSDYSASIIGSILDAEKIEIWTDVSGIYTTDPRVVKNAYPQIEVSFKEAAELAYFGAKVLHPSSILPAMNKNIPVYVKNTHSPDEPGTRIASNKQENKNLIAIAFRKNVTMINIESTRMLNAYGFLAKIFSILSKYEISVDLISTSEISVSLTLDSKIVNLDAIKELKKYANITIKENVSIIALVSENIKIIENFLETVFKTLKNIPVEMITYGSSNINLSIVVEDKFLEESIKKLHKMFFENI